jgi:hypothetical protein
MPGGQDGQGYSLALDPVIIDGVVCVLSIPISGEPSTIQARDLLDAKGSWMPVANIPQGVVTHGPLRQLPGNNKLVVAATQGNQAGILTVKAIVVEQMVAIRMGWECHFVPAPSMGKVDKPVLLLSDDHIVLLSPQGAVSIRQSQLSPPASVSWTDMASLPKAIHALVPSTAEVGPGLAGKQCIYVRAVRGVKTQEHFGRPQGREHCWVRGNFNADTSRWTFWPTPALDSASQIFFGDRRITTVSHASGNSTVQVLAGAATVGGESSKDLPHEVPLGAVIDDAQRILVLQSSGNIPQTYAPLKCRLYSDSWVQLSDHMLPVGEPLMPLIKIGESCFGSVGIDRDSCELVASTIELVEQVVQR